MYSNLKICDLIFCQQSYITGFQLYKTSDKIQIADFLYINSIIDILTEYNDNNQNDLLIAEMSDLKVSFDKIEMNYQYSAPETDKDKKVTTFTHTLEIKKNTNLFTKR